MSLASPTSWRLQSNLGFTFLASHHGGLSCRDTSDIHLTSAVLLSHEGRFYNPLLVSLNLKPGPSGQGCQVLLLDGAGTWPYLPITFDSAFCTWWFSSLFKLSFISLSEVRSLFHLASGCPLNFLSFWTLDLALLHFQVPPFHHKLYILYFSLSNFLLFIIDMHEFTDNHMTQLILGCVEISSENLILIQKLFNLVSDF